MARAATAGELENYRTPGKWSKLRVAVFQPSVVYRARINQVFSSTDSVLSITFDGGSGTLANVLPDMEMYIGSTLDAHDVGIVRIRSTDATHFYISETSDVDFQDDQYLTVVNSYSLWAKHVLISSGTPYMDGGTAYSDQHSNPAPTPVMGSHRVLKLAGASVSAQFDASASYVIGGLSSISGYAWSCATASGSSGTTTATPTFTFNTVGWHLVYLTLTTAGGKTFFGVRYVYVWNDANAPTPARIGNIRGDVDSGGWSFDVTYTRDADLEAIRDHALVILFAEDRFGGTQADIGPVEGSENIVAVGWIARESISMNPEQGAVKFTVYGAHYWLSQIPAFPDGVEFTTSTPAAWTEFQLLTVDRGLWHFLHWRTTATRVMDVFLTGDTKYTTEVSSLASNLWEQIREMSYLQIYARALVNAHGQLYVQVHPNLLPAASRSSIPTVMTIAKGDRGKQIDFERITKPECAVVSLSGVAVNSSGGGAAYFSLSPGHAYPHYGSIDVQDHLLVASQAEANQLAGLYRGWRNNPYPDILIPFKFDIRLVDICPLQQCAISIASGDTPRGNTYSGNLFPKTVEIVKDENGYYRRDVTFEAETFEDLSVNGDIAGGRADTTFPPLPGLPPLPDFPVIIPGTIEPSPNGPVKVLLHDTGVGLIYTENFHETPVWRTVNAGLTQAQYQGINFIAICPNGAIYVGHVAHGDYTNHYLFRAPSIGATFVQQTYPDVLVAAAINPLVSEQIGLLTATGHMSTATFRLGANDSFSAPGATIANFAFATLYRLSYGLGAWLYTTYDAFAKIAAAGGSVLATGGISPSSERPHYRVGTTGITFHNGQSGDSGKLIKGLNNMGSHAVVNSTDSIVVIDPNAAAPAMFMDADPTGTYLMTRGLGANKARSSDGGATWVAIPNLPPGNWFFQYAGGEGVNSRWIAVSGSQILYSSNFGDTWPGNRLGNMLTIAPTPAPDIIRVVQY